MIRLGPMGIAAALLLLAACSGGEPPRAELGAADGAITRAERSGAAERAPAELNSARMKYQGANTAMHGAEYDRAARLAREAEIDADLAAAKADAEAARAEAEAAARRLREDATAVRSEEASPPPVRAVARSRPIPLAAPAPVQ